MYEVSRHLRGWNFPSPGAVFKFAPALNLQYEVLDSRTARVQYTRKYRTRPMNLIPIQKRWSGHRIVVLYSLKLVCRTLQHRYLYKADSSSLIVHQQSHLLNRHSALLAVTRKAPFSNFSDIWKYPSTYIKKGCNNGMKTL
jgi:hypothetical protein